MSTGTVFGPTRHPGELEVAVEKALRRWMPTNVNHMAKATGKKLAQIKSYAVVSDYSIWPEIAPPSLVVESTGLIDPSDQEGDGSLNGGFAVSVFCTVQGPQTNETRDIAMRYWWPIAASLLQHRKLDDGIWVEPRVVDSGFAGANVEQRRTRVAIELVFAVHLEEFLNVGEGPLEPELEPDPGTWPEVESVETEVEKEN